MKVARVAFLHGVPREIVDLVTSYTPEGFTTTAVVGKLPEEELIKVVKEAQFNTSRGPVVDEAALI